MTETQAIDKVLNIALEEVGYRETGENVQKYGKEMHQIQPSNMDYPAAWCDAFVDWCFYKAFGKDLAKKILCGDFDDYTIVSAQLYKNAGRWTQTPKRGHQIFFQNSSGICHTGLVYDVSATMVYTIEGNTSDAVLKRSYDRTAWQIAGYGMPKYELAASTASTGRVGSCTVTLGTFLQGAKDPEINTIQMLLNGKGYKGKDGKKLTVNGVLDENTQYAITTLQKKAGMKDINFGSVAGATWKILLNGYIISS